MSEMNQIFILQNQDKLFLGKQKEWLDGRDAGSLFKTPYKDEAINQMVEMSSRDYTQRIKVLACRSTEKGLPMIEEELLPPPQPKAAKKFTDECAIAVIAAETKQMEEKAGDIFQENLEPQLDLANDDSDTNPSSF